MFDKKKNIKPLSKIKIKPLDKISHKQEKTNFKPLNSVRLKPMDKINIKDNPVKKKNTLFPKFIVLAVGVLIAAVAINIVPSIASGNITIGRALAVLAQNDYIAWAIDGINDEEILYGAGDNTVESDEEFTYDDDNDLLSVSQIESDIIASHYYAGLIKYAATANTTISNTAVETTMFASGLNAVGNLIIPADKLSKGSIIHIRMNGYYSTKAVDAGSFNIKTKMGGTTIRDASFSFGNGNDTMNWALEIDMVVRNTGALSGSCMATGTMLYNTEGKGLIYDYIESTDTTSIDTTNDIAIDVTAQWATADSDNSITILNATIETTYYMNSTVVMPPLP